MKFYESLGMALDALWQNRLRSFLALLGIVIGVFAVTAMVSLGDMLRASITKSLESVASRSIIVQPDYQNAGMEFRKLKREDLAALSRLPVVVNPQIQCAVQFDRKPGERMSMQAMGTEGDMPKVDSSIRMKRGRYFTRGEAEGGAPLAIISPATTREVFRGGNPIGRAMRLYATGGARLDVTVVGEIESISMPGGDQPLVYMPLEFLWRLHPATRRGEYDYAILKVRGDYDLTVLEKQGDKIMVDRYGKGVFKVQSIESFAKNLGMVTGALQIGLGFIAALSLVVGGIGIMNIMLVSVTERTREIGLRKALGATSEQIRTQFLIEAVALTCVGGGVGLAMATALLWIVSVSFDLFKGTFMLSPLTVTLALGVSIAVGLGFGVWPASRAAQLDPIESLRYE